MVRLAARSASTLRSRWSSPRRRALALSSLVLTLPVFGLVTVGAADASDALALTEGQVLAKPKAKSKSKPKAKTKPGAKGKGGSKGKPGSKSKPGAKGKGGSKGSKGKGGSKGSKGKGGSKGSQGTKAPTFKGTAVALPPLVQLGFTPDAPATGAVVAGAFQPAEAGVVTDLQLKKGANWVRVARKSTDATGQVAFPVDTLGTYRLSVSGSTTNAVQARHHAVLFSEEFSGALHKHTWTVLDSIRATTGVRTCARVSEDMVSTTGSTMRLGVALDGAVPAECVNAFGVSPHMLNSQVTTNGSFSFRYGYAAARMKLQKSAGMHSSFWMLPVGDDTLPRAHWWDSGAGEIDVVEYFGAGKALDLVSFIHTERADGSLYKSPSPSKAGYLKMTPLLKEKGQEWWNSYHVFSAEWTPSRIVFRVDGKAFYTETGFVPSREAYLLFSLLSSDYELKNLTADGLNDALEVDWVRVYGL